MPKTKTRVLAIDPGTREMGIALLEDKKLLYYGVEGIQKGKDTKATLKEGRRLVLRLIEDYRPDVLAVEKTYFANNKKAAVLNLFAVVIMDVGRRKGLDVVCYAPNTIKKFITGNGRASKLDVAKIVVAQYPELRVYLSQNRKWKQRYHLNMFDAVALGIMASVK
jgi:crossover junction endodeoxyribonuclease RuvC